MPRTKPRPSQQKASLAPYTEKRRFDRTPEPRGRISRRRGNLFTIQKHAARRLHYDLRLELDGVLKSWAVTRGPSLDPAQKRLAVRTEDHPIEYADFEGRIPEGNYGAGTVMVWDCGSWEPVGEPHEAMAKGKLVFRLDGERLKGRWALVRFKAQKNGKRENWLLIKEQDEHASSQLDVTEGEAISVLSGRTMSAVARVPGAFWDPRSGRKQAKGRAVSPLPSFQAPMLATLAEEVPSGDGWLFEIKFDGYRSVASVSGNAVRIYSRGGQDWTDRYPSVAHALSELELDGALLDGEIVAVDEDGKSDFSLLQQRLKAGKGSLSYFVFDLLEEAGRSLRNLPLYKRKALLKPLLARMPRRGPVFFVDHVRDGEAMLDMLCQRGWEGVIAKRSTSTYRSVRTKSWQKIKCGREQEFIIVGWSPSAKDRPFASILLGLMQDGRLVYAGRAGAGFRQADLVSLSRQFEKLARKRPPRSLQIPKAAARGVCWVEPILVAQIAFTEFTRDGIVRHGRFRGLREDKPAAKVTAEVAGRARRASEPNNEATVSGVPLTHPDKVLYPKSGLTKRDLAGYLDAAAETMLPYCSNRPVSLVRCPAGRDRPCFFQRHAQAGMPDEIRRLQVRSKDGAAEDYLYLNGGDGLLAAAQMGVLELHVWGSRIDDVDRPDRIVFDLDPDPALPFRTVKDAAAGMRDALQALGLTSFPLLTGGKGIHVVVPIQRGHKWLTVKAFAKALSERFADHRPDRYTAIMSKARRKGRIFIDYLRNERAATAIVPYSPRARDGAPVAWPLAWRELSSFAAANAVTLAQAKQRVKGHDPWPGYFAKRQSLTVSALRALAVAV